jgi:hypothetical protein
MIYFVEFALTDAEVEDPIIDIKKVILSFWQDVKYRCYEINIKLKKGANNDID